MSDEMTRDDLLTLMRAWGWRLPDTVPGAWRRDGVRLPAPESHRSEPVRPGDQMVAITRTFPVKLIRDEWGIHDGGYSLEPVLDEDGNHVKDPNSRHGFHLFREATNPPVVLHDKLIGTTRWDLIYEVVFRAPDDGHLYRVTYEEGATENQPYGGWEYDTEVVGTRVEPFEETVTSYRAVQA